MNRSGKKIITTLSAMVFLIVIGFATRIEAKKLPSGTQQEFMRIPWGTKIKKLKGRLKLELSEGDFSGYTAIDDGLKMSWCNPGPLPVLYIFNNGKFSGVNLGYVGKEGHTNLVAHFIEEFGDDYTYSTYDPPPEPYGISYIWNDETIFAYIRFWTVNGEGHAFIHYKPLLPEQMLRYIDKLIKDPFAQ